MLRLLVLLIVSFSLIGCKYVPKLDQVLPDKRTEYRKSTTLPDLEVPPDLSTEGIHDKMNVPEGQTATFSTYQQRVAERKKERAAAGRSENAVEAMAGEKVLVINGDTATVWAKLHTFWKQLGYQLDLDDAQYGVMETKWRDNPNDLSRDRFKVFAEPGEAPGTTTLYVSHDGQEQKPDGEKLTWVDRPRDESVEDKMVGRIRSYLSAGEEVAAGPADTGTGTAAASTTATAAAAAPAVGVGAGVAMSDGGDTGADTAGAASPATTDATVNPSGKRAKLVSAGDGKFLISYIQDFGGAWDATGSALPKLGFAVDSSDKARGIYTIRFPGASSENKGVLSRLAFWRKDPGKKEYQLSLTGVGKKTEIVVLDSDGKWDNSDTANQILDMLQAELNKG
jgi:outer membrane protein assembly factor BamC